jgi:hypothetical protein
MTVARELRHNEDEDCFFFGGAKQVMMRGNLLKVDTTESVTPFL